MVAAPAAPERERDDERSGRVFVFLIAVAAWAATGLWIGFLLWGVWSLFRLAAG